MQITHSMNNENLIRCAAILIYFSCPWEASPHRGTGPKACLLTCALCREGVVLPRCCYFSPGKW